MDATTTGWFITCHVFVGVNKERVLSSLLDLLLLVFRIPVYRLKIVNLNLVYCPETFLLVHQQLTAFAFFLFTQQSVLLVHHPNTRRVNNQLKNTYANTALSCPACPVLKTYNSALY